MILVPLLNPKFATAIAGTVCANFGFGALARRLFLHRRLHGVLDVLDLVELDIDDLAADLLDAPDCRPSG